MNTAKAEIVSQPVVRLTIELSNTHAAELGGLLAYHVDWEDFPWAESIYDALELAEIRGEAVFRDEQFGRDVLLRRKQGSALAGERGENGR